MKKILPFLIFLVLPMLLFGSEPLRENINFNRDWKFKLGDYPGAEAPTYKDSDWSAIGLPHSFSIPYFLSKDFYIGYGWYRKSFDCKPEWANKRIFLQFEAAFQDAEVYVNGSRIGEHKGGYTGFSMDITAAVKPGANVIAVRLNNKWDPRLAPRAGEHTFSGGIYRDVSLVVTDPLHVTWYGTFVTTPEISADSARVNIKTEVRNDGSSSAVCTVHQQIIDPEGNPVTEATSTQTVAPGAFLVFDQTTDRIPHPRLWHPDHPFLYSVRTTVLNGNKPVDEVVSPLGFRWMKWTADQGFFLNGEHFYFHGANVHQDHAGWGDAVTDAAIYRDVKLLKEAGFDFIRGSHYPHSPALSDACDKLGVLLWSENCFWGTGGIAQKGNWNSSAYPTDPQDQSEFEQSVKDTLRDEIRIHRNHPSVAIWSMCNEVFFSDKSVMDKVRNLLSSVVRETHELDPTRPAAIGGSQRGDLDKLGDVAGYNGDGARLFKNPGIANVVSEYGAILKPRPGNYDPYWGDLQKEAFPWRSGQSIWCGFDHGSIGGFYRGQKGVIDYFRLPKRSWYWYRNEYKKIPPPEWPQPGIAAKLQLTASNATISGTDATDDCQLVVSVLDAQGKPISNSPPVTLSVEQGPGEFPTGRSITFNPGSDISIRDGMAAIEFRSYFAGTSTIRATSPGLQDATLTITITGAPVFVPGQTPPVADRPYHAFRNVTTTAMADGNLATDRPTQVSSEAPDHSGRMANDGNAATYWSPADNRPNPCWQLDLEQITALSKSKINFGSKSFCPYKIEISDDGSLWTLVVDQPSPTGNEQTRTDSFPAGSHGRYVRITLIGVPAEASARISEVEVDGHVLTP
jgi:beta-galactosidase